MSKKNISKQQLLAFFEGENSSTCWRFSMLQPLAPAALQP
jgi:hypothetical protein